MRTLYKDSLVTLHHGDGLGLAVLNPNDHIVVTDPPTELGFPFRREQVAHLIVHPHYLAHYPTAGLCHVSAWVRPAPGLTRDGWPHAWNAVLHYGQADLTTDIFWDDAPRVTTHPAERGVAPLVDLISALPDGVILDPFCGSGSVLVAARECGRRAVGVEIDAGFAEMARSRLAS